ncbi:GHMP kinase [Pseudonocardia sp. NPDC049635]|uniref:GHMP family kinase ATP-binding protein n=1 Tax=Pseudonocardia sp. NPDC049635 TaxID=3155506 RepID=UPI0033D138CD
MRTGHGYSGCHHGELLQGFFRGPGGTPRPGLVTLPSPAAGVHARFRPDPELTGVTVHPPGRTKAARAAGLALRRVTPPGAPWGGRLRLAGPVTPGLGMGSSTADVVAAVRAVADACGAVPDPHTVARIAVAAEGASDPLMFDDPAARLFAQRDGVVVEVLGPSLPPLLVLGCLLDGGRPVDTPAGEPAVPAARLVDAYEELRDRLRAALAVGDPAGVAAVATRSARLHRTDDQLDRLLAAAEVPGVLGVQIAHSGSVAGLLVDPAGADPAVVVERADRALRATGLAVTGPFVVGTGSAAVAAGACR